MTSHSWNDPHIVRAGRFLLKAISFTLGAFLFLFVLLHIIGTLYISSIAEKSKDAFVSGIEKDKEHFKKEGDAIAEDKIFIQKLFEEDADTVLTITQKERELRDIGTIGVANKEGVIISRTIKKGVPGQNVFLTVPAGRIVAKGESAESIELTGFGNQLFLTTARPVIYEEEMIGALFANYLTNDKYAERFRDKYLPKGTEVAFYSKEFGIYGNSISDPKTRKLVKSYFNSGSEWIKNSTSGKTISFKNGNYYIVENITFPGLEQSPGGALIFVPRRDISSVADLSVAFLTLCIFIFFALKHHLHSWGEERGWRYYTILLAASVPILLLAFFALRIQHIGYSKLERIPYTLYNSTLRIQPEFGIYDIDFEQRFSIIVDTGDEAINAAEIGLLFDPKAIEIKKLEINDSTCSYVIENVVNASLGRADFSCVVLKSSGEQGSLPVAEVTVVPRKTGTFTLSFDKEKTRVLASDGLGTDVLRMSQPGSYEVNAFGESSAKEKTGLVVFSPTHPNKSRWYNIEKARFVWTEKDPSVYAYALDSSPSTIPSNEHTTQDTNIELPIRADGVFYFHIRSISGGPTTHYRLQEDTTPPSIISMKISADRVVVGDVVRFLFEAEDSGSGVQKNYYADLGNHLFLPIGSNLFIPFLEPGDQGVTLRVYDDAGNYSEKTEIINVENKPS